MFIVGKLGGTATNPPTTPDEVRPKWVIDFMHKHPELRFHTRKLRLPDRATESLADVVERLPVTSPLWWDKQRTAAFVKSLSPIQRQRLKELSGRARKRWRTAYRRTRNGVAVWEMRPDPVSGCLRTARGGSSKQAVVEMGDGVVRVRWMTATEYAALQGAPDFQFSTVSENKALFGFGDAVCVPVIAWLARSYLVPLLAAAKTAA
jgi:DNA (cytosine-5)-methyltransferase 1